MPEESHNKKILLVIDDDQLLLNLYKRMFESRGIGALLAKDGEEGLRLIKEQKPDFVILDIRMPKLDGIEVLKIVRADQQLRDTPVLILTNFDLEEYQEQVKELGVVDFLVKAETVPEGIVERVCDFLNNNKQVNNIKSA